MRLVVGDGDEMTNGMSNSLFAVQNVRRSD